MDSISKRGLGRLVVVVVAFALAGCDKYYTDPSSAEKVLANSGYSEIQFTGYDWFACSRDDVYHTGFTAKSPTGAAVKGVVCKGFFFKSSTIRFAD